MPSTSGNDEFKPGCLAHFIAAILALIFVCCIPYMMYWVCMIFFPEYVHEVAK